MEQGGAFNEVPSGVLRHLLAYNKSVNCTDVHAGGSALSHKSSNRKGAPGWLGQKKIRRVDDTRGTVKFQIQTSEAARY